MLFLINLYTDFPPITKTEKTKISIYMMIYFHEKNSLYSSIKFFIAVCRINTINKNIAILTRKIETIE